MTYKKRQFKLPFPSITYYPKPTRPCLYFLQYPEEFDQMPALVNFGQHDDIVVTVLLCTLGTIRKAYILFFRIHIV